MRNTKSIVSGFIFISFFLILVNVAAYAQTPPGNVADLAAQGSVRTCLIPQWGDDSEGKGYEKVRLVHLKGRCESPGGCECVLYQHPNNAVAADAEGELDSEFCNKTANLSEPEKTKTLARVLGISTKLLAKWAPKQPLSPEEQEIRDKKLRNRCQKAINEANQPVLRSVPVGTRRCSIVKNNLASANLEAGKSNVLGVTSEGKIPYGNVDIVVKELTYKHAPLEFSAVGNNDSKTTVDTAENNLSTAGNDNTLKNGWLSFLKGKDKTTVTGLDKDCLSITWDPYGRVFDAQSLEPLPEALVDLIDNSTNENVVMKQNLSYDVTGDDGLYNIQVDKEGEYKLTVDPLTPHSFVQSPLLSKYWRYIYSDLYTKDTTFKETYNTPTHADIALQPDGEPFREAVAKIVPGTLNAQDMNGTIFYKGRSTFPMALTCLVHEITGEQVGDCVHANNVGYFTISLQKEKVPLARLRVVTKKVNLNDPKLYSDTVKVEPLHFNSLMLSDVQKSYFFEPILSLVEGYAYDLNHKVIPNAVVRIVLKESKQLAFETAADDKGYFVIYADKLPYMEYNIEFRNPQNGAKLSQTTSQFASLNATYLAQNKINLLLSQKNGKAIVKKTAVLNTINRKPDLIMQEFNKNSISPLFQSQLFALIGIITILLIAGAFIIMKVLKERSIK